MYAHIDSYSQTNILLSKEEAIKFNENGVLEGEIQRSGGDALPLKLRVSEKGWRAEGLPINSFYKEKKSYEIDIPPDGLQKILKGRCIGTDMPTVKLRKVYISLDSVL